jgi:acetolactate synthase-1/3 small subunit
MNERFTVGLIVTNRHGVLNRIAGLYGKRGYNIDSLAVGETEDPNISRMTIVSTGDRYISTQVVRQLNKLYDVKLAVLLEEGDSVSVEHLLIKIKTNGDGNVAITSLLNDYGGKILEFGNHFIVADLTGEPKKIQEFIKKCVPLGIIELCRSGALALSTGTSNILSIKDFSDNKS